MILNIKPKDIGTIITGSPGEDPKMLANFKDLLDKVFILDPEKRLTVSQALNHPFITGKWTMLQIWSSKWYSLIFVHIDPIDIKVLIIWHYLSLSVRPKECHHSCQPVEVKKWCPYRRTLNRRFSVECTVSIVRQLADGSFSLCSCICTWNIAFANKSMEKFIMSLVLYSFGEDRPVFSFSALLFYISTLTFLAYLFV